MDDQFLHATPIDEKLSMLNFVLGQALRDSDLISKQSMNLVDEIPLPLIMVDPDLNFGYINHSFKTWSGYIEENLTSLRTNSILDQEALEEINKAFFKFNKKKISLSCEVTLAQGKSNWCIVHGFTFRDSKGKVETLALFFNDVQKLQDQQEKLLSMEKEKQELLLGANSELEEKVKERTKELENSLKELKETQEHLIQSEKMSSLGMLIAGVAHEVNNPLNFIRNAGNVLYEQLNDIIEILNDPTVSEKFRPSQKQKLAQIRMEVDQNYSSFQRGVYRIVDIVSALIRYSRREVKVKYLTDLTKLYRDTEIILASRTMGIKLELDIPTHHVFWECAPTDISQIMLNIMNNAIDASAYAKTKKLEIRLAVDSDQVLRFSVRDYGHGVDSAIENKIFDPFFTTKHSGKGTGLGLSIAKRLALDHNGDLLLRKPDKGPGALFILELRPSSDSE